MRPHREVETDSPKIVFGEVVPCEKCRATGTYRQPVDNKKIKCPACDGSGFREWRSDALGSDVGASA